MKNLIIILPLLIPFFTAVLSIFFWWKLHIQRWINAVGVFAYFTSCIWLFLSVMEQGTLVSYIGNWNAPFGIVLVADSFSSIMVLVSGILSISSLSYSTVSLDRFHKKLGYYPLLQFLFMSVTGAFLTGDLFNLYVWFELLLISSFVLITLGSSKAQLEGAIKYVTLNLFASVVLLTAVGMMYGYTGSLNMADLSLKLHALPDSFLTQTLAIFFLIAFGIKAAVFPLFFWLPASYHTPPVSISAIFAGLLTKVGVYSIFRIFSLFFAGNFEFLQNILLIVAGFTMLTGVLGAVIQTDIRRLLSFHIISQIGYMIMGFAIFTPLAVAGAIYFILHNIIVKNVLFLMSGIIYKITGEYDLKKLGGLYKERPLTALLFILPALSLAGIPPLSGFWGKLILIKAAIDSEQYVITAVAVIVSFFTLFSMVKIWNEAFWKKKPDTFKESDSLNTHWVKYSKKNMLLIIMPVLWLILIMLTISFFIEPSFSIVNKSAIELLNPDDYINKVLNRN
jgi:multicomponent Na+:H+ antiporter subunit D